MYILVGGAQIFGLVLYPVQSTPYFTWNLYSVFSPMSPPRSKAAAGHRDSRRPSLAECTGDVTTPLGLQISHVTGPMNDNGWDAGEISVQTLFCRFEMQTGDGRNKHRGKTTHN